MTFLEVVAAAIEAAGSYDRNDQAAPAAILWPDAARAWVPLLSRLRERLPLLTFGDYDAETRTGPAYWVRCVLAGAVDAGLSPGVTPVIYLPGIGVAQLRAVAECPRLLQPLVELQFRGAVSTQPNGQDWTPAAILESVGVTVAADAPTSEALSRALVQLADEPIDLLRQEAPLRASFFDALLHPDDARSLLLWLNDPVRFRQARDRAEWEAFCGLCRRKFDFDPEVDGELAAAQYLGRRAGNWGPVWRRFAEAPAAYAGLPERLRQGRPSQVLPLIDHPEAWPQENEVAEARLREELQRLPQLPPGNLRPAVARLEAEHGFRRGWVWARLGRAPLALALEPLALLARATDQPVGGASVDDVAEAYASVGWQADAAVLDALAAVEQPADVAAVTAAIVPLYRPWLAAGAEAWQRLVARDGPDGFGAQTGPAAEAGTCVLFSDGLRFDLAKRLASALAEAATCSLDWRLAALPTVTATAKSAISPIAEALAAGPELTPTVRASGARVTAEVLRRLLADRGVQVLGADDTGDPRGRAWTELGDIDSYLHERGWKVAYQVAPEIRALRNRIVALLDHGWQKVVVITDHGWLLLPGGLPKSELPEHLTEVRKGRCARLKPTSSIDGLVVPWRWDPDVQIAVAPGIHCFEAGRDGEHGGLSPQECGVPVLTVSPAARAADPISVATVTWRGLRCSARVQGGTSGLMVDLRTKAGDRATSLVKGGKALNADGGVTFLVEDEDQAGQGAVVVVLGADGGILAQSGTVVGG